MEYRVAREAENIGQEIISEYHPHLLGLRVDFVFIDKKPKSKAGSYGGVPKRSAVFQHSWLPAILNMIPTIPGTSRLRISS